MYLNQITHTSNNYVIIRIIVKKNELKENGPTCLIDQEVSGAKYF